MYNTYVSSTLSLRCKGSLTFQFNDYSCLLNDRFDRNPTSLSSQSCCSCCSNSTCRVPINPSFLCGLRQSSLIHWSASRRLFLGGGDHYYCRLPDYNVGQSCCCGHVCPVNERGFNGRRRGRLGEGKFRFRVSEEKNKRRRSCDIDDAEVMLSLLTEEVGEECIGERERNVRSFKIVEVEKRGRESGGGTSCTNKKKNVTCGLSESKSKKSGFESVTVESREDDYRRKEDGRKEDRESHLRGEKCRMRKAGSSCSSYYSCSSLGELEIDTEIQGRQEEYIGESESGEATYYGQTVEEEKRHGDVGGSHGIVIREEKNVIGSYAPSSGIECDWRKKSEKKLTEVSVEQTESSEKSSNKNVRLSEVCETGYRKPSSSHPQFQGREENSTLGASADDKITQHYGRQDAYIGQSESRVKHKHIPGVQEIHESDEAFCSSEKRVSDGEENLRAEGSLVRETRGEHTKTAGRISQKDEYKRNSQQISEVSKTQEINDRVTSITSRRPSQARVKKQEATVTLTEISGKHHIDIDKTSASLRQSDTRMENRVDNANFTSGPSAETKEQQFRTGQQAIKKMESRKESQGMPKISTVHYRDTPITGTQRAFEKRISSEETYSTSVIQSTKETIERCYLTEEIGSQIGSRKEPRQRRTSGSEAALILKTRPTVQHIGVDVEDKSGSQVIMTRPSSQLVARDRLHIVPSSDFAIQEASTASLESGSGALHTHEESNAPASGHEIYGGPRRGETHEEPLNFLSHEDALGSADRLQKSSMQFVGEFVEKVTHEVSTSKVQKELVNEGNKQQQESLSQYGSGDFKSKEQDSRRSSQSSGEKGPSDEIWDVTALPGQEPTMTEATESTNPSSKTITKRTGRSLWHVISDIVRLRWASRSSGGRSSPNKSTSSDTWFSGHELDENRDGNAKMGKESMSHDPTIADQQLLETIPTGNQGEGSTSASSKDKIGHVGGEARSSSSISESGSASNRISSVPIEESFGRSGTAMVESSVSMPSLHIRRSPGSDEISEAGKTDVSASGSLVQEQPTGTSATEVSGIGGKDGELKRRKFQRNDQFMKDRFDEWEEAYQLESEQRRIDEMFMKEALLEAKKAADMWEVPVGAVLVQHGKIIARGYNLVEELRDSTAHAEMICIREASNLLRTWRLSETTLYVTLEPCPMCAGAILQARVNAVVWGAPNKLLGADGSWIRLFPNGGGEGGNASELTDKPPAPVHPFHPNIAIRRGVLAAECADAMQRFFQLRRRKEKKPGSPPTPPSCLPISNHPNKFFTKMHDTFHFMFCL
ncbi:tRNA(adenine(34)) deaminase, chloroplastic [Actinidia eriantha]|uniref:tRNA(adenine(34)) deaminase, chloroplastic n=1 Tax=Actinidia eriantha TaxID=165200 RepID=UPI002588B1A3|nr:tRNA(adenine(34)) deaminase, chloroplastic [Actinidia eriantha]